MSHTKKRARNVRQLIYLVLMLTVSVGGALYYYDWRTESRLTPMTFVNPDGSETPAFKLEVVNTPAGRSKGLMFRRTMKTNHGMVFVFPDSAPRSFYMKNTYLPLDMLFLDAQHTVVGLLENVPILNTEPRAVAAPAQYVIELNAGTSKAHGITIGSRARYQRPLPAATE